MSNQRPALEWLARRHDGESITHIAHHAGVSPAAVRWATKDYGPFPRATQRLGRVVASDEAINARTERWIDARRRGVTVADIARAEGVSHQIVSRSTLEHGPFPTPEVVEAWVEGRRQGRTVPVIANEHDVRPAVVRRETAPYGPFPAPGASLPEGVLGVKGIARAASMSEVAVNRWVRQGITPSPDFVTRLNRPLWLEQTIHNWLDETTRLATCPTCGARCLSVRRHRGVAHRSDQKP